MSEFEIAKDYSEHLANSYSARKQKDDEYERIYMLNGDEEDKVKAMQKNIKLTKSVGGGD
jgi:hypothetical protein